MSHLTLIAALSHELAVEIDLHAEVDDAPDIQDQLDLIAEAFVALRDKRQIPEVVCHVIDRFGVAIPTSGLNRATLVADLATAFANWICQHYAPDDFHHLEAELEVLSAAANWMKEDGQRVPVFVAETLSGFTPSHRH